MYTQLTVVSKLHTPIWTCDIIIQLLKQRFRVYLNLSNVIFILLIYVSRLRVALRFGCGVSRNFRQIRNYDLAHGVHKTLSSCQQNPILCGRAGLTTPTRLGFLFRLTFTVTPLRNSNYDSNTKCKGHRYGTNDSSGCWLHRASNAINSIITQKQL